jgi:hypothetical protein
MWRDFSFNKKNANKSVVINQTKVTTVCRFQGMDEEFIPKIIFLFLKEGG